MRRNTILLAATIVSCFLSLPLQAQETLDLDQARSKALANSKTLKKALLGVDSAVATETIQSYEMLPSLSSSIGANLAYGTSTQSSALKGSAGISLSQTIYSGGKRTLLSAIDAISTKIAREDARALYFDVLDSVDSAFFGALEAKASVDAAQSDVNAYQTHLKLAQAKLEAGIIAKYAFLETESETAAKETALIQAQGKLAAARGKLASLVGMQPTFTMVNVDFTDREALMKKVSEYSTDDTAALIANVWKAAVTNNPSLAQAGLAGERARKNVDLTKADYLPSVSANLSQTFSVFPDQSLDSVSGSVSVSATIPLDFWTMRANIESKNILVKTANLDQEETIRNLSLLVQSAAYDCISSARSVFSSQKAFAYAENYYDSVLEMYRLSSASSSDLSDAEALVSANRSALITARYSFLNNLTTLRTLGGFESDSLLLSVIP